MKIYPSLISSDLLDIRSTLKLLDNQCDGYHIDVMDNHFVPNLTWGHAFVNAIKKETALPLQVHLMVNNPELWIDRLSLSSKDSILFHKESIRTNFEIENIIKKIKQKDIKAGIVYNPDTSISIDDFPKIIDAVLIMSVNPGFSGQMFIPKTMEKVSILKDIKAKSFEIFMDGGINKENIVSLKNLGVDGVSVASSIFNSNSYTKNLSELYSALK